jgi:hypothetical protein
MIFLDPEPKEKKKLTRGLSLLNQEPQLLLNKDLTTLIGKTKPRPQV